MGVVDDTIEDEPPCDNCGKGLLDQCGLSLLLMLLLLLLLLLLQLP
jgi:hypothetical protein